MKLGDKTKEGHIRIIYYKYDKIVEIIVQPFKGGSWISKKINKNEEENRGQYKLFT